MGWGIMTPWKYVGGSGYVLTHLNVTFSHSKLLLDNSASFTSLRMEDLCQEWKAKLIFRGAWWFDLTLSCHILRQNYATGLAYCWVWLTTVRRTESRCRVYTGQSFDTLYRLLILLNSNASVHAITPVSRPRIPSLPLNRVLFRVACDIVIVERLPTAWSP